MEKDSFGEGAARPRTPRESTGPGRASGEGPAPALTPAPARTTPVVAGDFLLTVNPVDGSEIEPCPPGGAPHGQGWTPPPRRRTPAERAAQERAAQPPVPAGPAAPRLALVERDGPRAQLGELLGRGRSVRLTGPRGSGRSALLDLVAQDCAAVAPAGVVRLNGLHRTATELLYELFAVVHTTDRHRLGRDELLAEVRQIGAVVVLDDLEFGGTALTDFLDAAPECAFLLAAAPDVAAPDDDALLDEIALEGLSRPGALELLARVVDRDLTEDEKNWAGDLWFESEGLPLRFVQAGALLRQYDELYAADPEEAEDASPFDGTRASGVRLPTLGQGAAPAALLASRLSEAAREALRFAVALGGEVPHQAHLPALIGDTHADAALGELTGCGLLSPAGPRYRLAAGVLAQLQEKGYAGDPAESAARAHTAAQHYAWWAAHPSVTAERVVVEADAVLAALSALVENRAAGQPSAAVLLARSAAPAFAAGLHWGAWESALRMGSTAARIAGEVAEQAYFHHELGVLALCTDNLGRARAELEASIGLRGALADRNGAVAGRRALTLVTDRERRLNGEDDIPTALAVPAAPGALELRPAGPVAVRPGPVAGGGAPAGDDTPVRGLTPVPALVPLTGAGPSHLHGPPGAAGADPSGAPDTLIAGSTARTPVFADDAKQRRRRVGFGNTRRNLAAAGAGALLVAVLGTVASLGTASDKKDLPGTRVGTDTSASEEDGQNGQDEQEGLDDGSGVESTPGGEHTGDPATRPTPSSSASPSGSKSPEESASPSRTTPQRPSTTPSKTPPASSSQGPKPTKSSTPPSTPPSSTPPTTPPSSPAPSPPTSSLGESTEAEAQGSAGPAATASSAEPESKPESVAPEPVPSGS
ncbi:ATP-binding protein [Streptomyces sp. NPDC048057]|uniref:ATP-binding protein n=1 Tax=Streptomyces sp. NPDC048057 TaxID=3155628 RepID=UPI00340440A0